MHWQNHLQMLVLGRLTDWRCICDNLTNPSLPTELSENPHVIGFESNVISPQNNYIAMQGAQSSKCLELARLHSHAVDFPKCGRPVDFKREQRAASHPDFMMNKRKQQHRSRTIIGQLFRAINIPSPPLLSEVATETVGGCTAFY